jgi:5-methyltetrahydrofolate--homocysteine methyltransferase
MLLQDLLAQGRPLLADGATATNYFEMGLASGESPELWNVTHPERVRALHQKFVDAGADIILTNSFGGNARRLSRHKLEARVYELNKRAAELAREVADAAGRPIVVAGSVGPTGDLPAPLGPLRVEDAEAMFVDQIDGLKAGGVDVIWIETMWAPEEIRAAAKAAARRAMPYCVTASFDADGKTTLGLSPETLAALAASLDPPPLAFGANCGVSATDLMFSALRMTGAAPQAKVIAKANAGLPRWRGASLHYSGTPELMSQYAAYAVDAGVAIVGGCCGNRPDHIAAMRRALDGYVARPRPDESTLVAVLGPPVAPPRDDEGLKRRRRRGAMR